jgi:hypothetical protein
MNNIYEQKANKYKYKYLKLKREIEGGFGSSKQTEYSTDYINCKKDCKKNNNISKFNINNLKYKLGYISPEFKECIEICNEEERIKNLPEEEKQKLREEEQRLLEEKKQLQQKELDDYMFRVEWKIKNDKEEKERKKKEDEYRKKIYEQLRIEDELANKLA